MVTRSAWLIVRSLLALAFCQLCLSSSLGATPAVGNGVSEVVSAFLVKLEMDKVEYSTPVLYIISFFVCFIGPAPFTSYSH
jgi:hypothetical protein